MTLRRPESSPRRSANEAPQDNEISLVAPLRGDAFPRPLGAPPLVAGDTLAGHVNNARQILQLTLETVDPSDPHAAAKYLAAIGSVAVRLRHAAQLLERAP